MQDGGRRLAHVGPVVRAIAGTTVLLVAAGAWIGVRATNPTDGAPSLPDAGYGAGVTIDPLAAHPSGLRPGDIVVAVNGVPLDRWLSDRSPPRPSLREGTDLVYRVRRGATTLDVPVQLQRGGFVADRLRSDGLPIALGLAIVALGAFTVARRPEQPAARALLLLGGGLTCGATFQALAFETADLVAARARAVVGLAGALTGLTVQLMAMAQLALNFPSRPTWLGRRPRLGRAVYWGTLAGNVGVGAGYLASGRATLAGLDALEGPRAVLYLVLAVATIGGVVRTIRRARYDDVVRRQGTLVAFGLLLTILALLLGNLVAGDDKWPGWVIVLMLLPLSASVAIAIARGEFLDIRATVNRTFLYLSLTMILLGLFTAVVAVSAATLGSTGAVGALPATAIVAVAFAPVRARVQSALDRLLYGDRGDPARVLAALGERLEAATSAHRVLPEIAESRLSTLRLPYVAITTIATGDGVGAQLACERGERPELTEAIALVHHGRSVGAIVVGVRRGERGLAAADQALLGNVARHVAIAVSAAQLMTDLAASRSHVAVAHEEERARVRHDLHDRLGTHLVALSMQLERTAEDGRDPNTVEELRVSQAAVERALDELRRISRGLRPAELEQLGLIAAIQAAATRLSIDGGTPRWKAIVDAAIHLPSIEAEIESADYQIAIEALTNACRHSGGHQAVVTVGVDADGANLLIDVIDDGHGIDADASAGVGLQSMRDRAAAISSRDRARSGAFPRRNHVTAGRPSGTRPGAARRDALS